MPKLLTIAIPTYNRASILDRQLAWLAQDIKEFESECEIIVSDNCSTDDTQDALAYWQTYFARTSTSFKVNTNKQNIGVIKNVAYCMNAATSKYVWTIGDDDVIQQQTVAYIFNNIKKHLDLAVLILNFSATDYLTGKLLSERRYLIEDEELYSNGKAVFEYCLQSDHVGLAFLTALVYRTELIQQAIQKWTNSVNSLEAQIFWTGFCAAGGSVKISKDVYVDYTCGTSYWLKNPKSAFQMNYSSPAVYLKLEEIGYSKIVCRRMLLKHWRNENNLRVILGALRRWPLRTIKIMAPYLALVSVSAWQVFLSRQDKNQIDWTNWELLQTTDSNEKLISQSSKVQVES